MTGGYEAGNTYAAAVCAADGGFALVYVPSRRPTTVDLSRLAGPVRASRYDPTSGATTPLAPVLSRTTGERVFVPPGSNSAGDDWVLVLDAQDRE